MNSNSEAFQSKLLAWLQDTASTAAPPTGEPSSNDGVENPLTDAAVPHGGEAKGFSPQTFKLGEIPAVQDRFHAVLKRRLQTEIQRRPPLFPWETEVYEYSDIVDAASVELVPAQLWTAQQRNLYLPVPLPEMVFARLLNQCQALGQSSLKLGEKLVRAVEDLFPGESWELNDIAVKALISSHPRNGMLAELPEIAAVPRDYEAATPRQQMVLSVMAALRLLEAFTLELTPNQRSVKRQWLTLAGLLTIQAEYQPDDIPRLRVQGELPCSGSLKLQGGTDEATAQCSSPGYLSVELFDFVPNQSYLLEVSFQVMDSQPLIFTICPTM